MFHCPLTSFHGLRETGTVSELFFDHLSKALEQSDSPQRRPFLVAPLHSRADRLSFYKILRGFRFGTAPPEFFPLLQPSGLSLPGSSPCYEGPPTEVVPGTARLLSSRTILPDTELDAPDRWTGDRSGEEKLARRKQSGAKAGCAFRI